MIILAVDQSYTSCGIVVLSVDDNDKSKISILDFNIFKSNPELIIFDRAYSVSTEVMLYLNRYNPDHVAIEGLSFSNIGNATRDLAGLQFTIYQHIRRTTDKNIIIVSPKSVKKHATGKGNSKKSDMLDSSPNDVIELFTSRNFKKTTGLYDLIDAYWIGLTSLDHIGSGIKKET